MRIHLLTRARIVCAVSVVLLMVSSAAPSAFQDQASVIPKDIEVPAGHKLLFKLDGIGVQVYKATKSESGKLEWTHEGPLANLFEAGTTPESTEFVGYHYDGPSWEALDGSKIVRDKSVPIKSAPPPPQLNAMNAVPWLLVKVKAEDAAGRFGRVTYVQRLTREGGLPPKQAPKHEGTMIAMHYSAWYYFYGKAD